MECSWNDGGETKYYIVIFDQLHVKRICRYVFNDSKSAGLRPDRND